MARVCTDPYTSNHLTPRATPGTIADGIDELGFPAKFIYVQHVNAVTVVKGHCAILAAVPAAGSFKVTNDVSGGATTPIAGHIAVGSYCAVITENYYCWVLCRGWETNLLGDGSVAAGEAITAKAADGTWDTLATTIPPSGYAATADSGSPTVFTGFVRCM
jgi:hypothetical protein